ncbi:MAG: helix-turn-helix domain-containing protein [Woeseia sp.]
MEDVNRKREPSGHDTAGPVGGERLAETRRARGISLREIAKELHLDEPKVRALEENRFDVLGAPVFAKGHMRKYAELVGVAVDDVLADYYQLNRSVGAPPVVGPPRKVRREISVGPWVATILVILVVAVAVWWWFSLTPSTEPLTVQPATLAPFESDRPDEATSDEPTPPENGEAPVQPAEQTAMSVSEPGPGAAEPAESGITIGNNVELALTFSGDCWTEVTDATGRRLFFDLGTEGRTVTLTGMEPLAVLFGNSSHVSVLVNGFDYGIPATSRRGNTARLTIYGQ